MTSVALYDQTTQKYYCLILDEKNQIEAVEGDKEIRPYKTEAEMLSALLDLWEELDPTIISGWNNGFFDIPYMYYRICNVLGKDQAIRLSPLRKLNFTEWDQSQPIELAGINHLD